ncbi:hypothetical protein DENIS_4491 [Desulfonema ishimotonii]|uniref:HD domain-containing protein n=1 Tax=Desulfonema ishimotonii TaxID=45657 RepID=A0A401G2P4_9BACT|nr:HD domain-containing protein [Desulfonema ishimotonii]GBC63497.1 hypothetical protein DENIS_4491 [Desulfonema ishimotonii]
MTEIYARIRSRARQIACQYPAPAFYGDFPGANAFSRRFFETDVLILKIRRFVAEHLENDFGHGLQHAVRVSLDAGALIFIESRQAGGDTDAVRHNVRLAQCAGLLHDVKRREKNHARAGADYAQKLLKSCLLPAADIEKVVLAIRNHEAFTTPSPPPTPAGRLLSDCLYDADKFRWGPDNFTDTVWDMAASLEIPIREFACRYAGGMEKLASIRATFRSDTGKIYGPQFIDIGIAIGDRVYDIIQTEFIRHLR